MRTLHLADAVARNDFVRFVIVKGQAAPQNVVNSRPVSMRRSLASRGANTYEAQQIADALIGDNIKKGWSEVHSQSEAHAETA